MSDFKNTIKGRMFSTNTKNYSSLEKIAQVIDKSPDQDNSYTISVVGSDGVKSIYEDVCVRFDASITTLKKEPQIGDYVYVKEDFRRFVIVGIYEEYQEKSLYDDIYTNLFNGAGGGECF